MKFVTAAIAVAAILLIYVRLRPIPSGRYSERPGPAEVGRHAMRGGCKVVLPAKGDPGEALARLEDIILATPRTRKVAEGAFVTRSKVMGFPDITRIWAEGQQIHIHGALVIGKSDLGVNRARIEGWLQALEPLDQG